MKQIANFLFIILILCAYTISSSAATATEDGEKMFRMGLGWNIGNQMDAFRDGVADETCWNNPPATQETFDNVAHAGFTAVRIPVTWMGHIGDAPDYKIEKSWMDRVAQLVDYAEKAGLKVIVNIHHDGADSKYWLNVKNAAKDNAENARIKAELKAIWTQIAKRFKRKGSFLVFESMNEIHDGGWGWGENLRDGGRQYEIVNEWNQVFVDAVRSAGGKNKMRYLGVPGYCTNPDLTMKHFRMPTDKVKDRLMVAVHFYDPYKFTLANEEDEWGHTASKNEGKYNEEQHVDAVFSKLETTFVNCGVPLYIGEFGCTHRSNPQAEVFRKKYLEYVCQSARKHNLSLFLWDNGSRDAGEECSGFLDHGTGEYINGADSIVRSMTKAYFGEK